MEFPFSSRRMVGVTSLEAWAGWSWLVVLVGYLSRATVFVRRPVAWFLRPALGAIPLGDDCSGEFPSPARFRLLEDRTPVHWAGNPGRSPLERSGSPPTPDQGSIGPAWPQAGIR
jgi:hypothetical protein